MPCDLPHEIVSEIASHLPYRDIVAFCKALVHRDLCDATNAYIVWLNLATQYLAEHPHSHLSNTSCLSSLITNQLRQRFEKRLMVNEIWQLPREVYLSIKRLKYPSSTLSVVKIAPGGRWVFGGTAKCTLCYWDLDSDNPEPFFLLPVDGVCNIPGRHCSISEMEVTAEPGEPLSGFVIAFVGCDLDFGYHGESREWLYIWGVRPRENGTLEAKHLKALWMPYAGFHPRFSFNEHMAARYLEKTRRLDVYWWKECTETHLTRCTLLFEKGPIVSNIYVLGKDKLLVYTRDYDDNHKGRLYVLKLECSKVADSREVISHATKI